MVHTEREDDGAYEHLKYIKWHQISERLRVGQEHLRIA